MPNNHALSRAQKFHHIVLNRRYFRTDKPWSQYQLAEGDPLSTILQTYDIKLKKFLDEHGKDLKRGVTVEEILIGIGCPKPWDAGENKIYLFLLGKISVWYNRKYLQVIPEQLKTGEPIPFNPYRRSPRRKPPSDSWRPVS